MKPILVIPAKDEGETILRLVLEAKHYARVIVVDDGSTDATRALAAAAGARIKNGLQRGVGAVIRACLYYGHDASETDERAGYFFVMDAGGTHDPAWIPLMLKTARDHNADLVIASRFLASSQPTGRRARLSRLAAWVARKVLRINVTDATTGFRCYKSEFALRTVNSESKALGHAVQLEILGLMANRGAKIVEVSHPYKLVGGSSFKRWMVLEALWVVWCVLVDGWMGGANEPR